MTANIKTRPYRLPSNGPIEPHKPQNSRKRIKWKRAAALAIAALGACYLCSTVHAAISGNDEETANAAPAVMPAAPSEQSPTMNALDPGYTFETYNGTPVDIQAITNAWAKEAGYVKRYELTDEERWEVASVVTAEAGGEPYAGMMAVAQCILQAAEDDGIRPTEVVDTYGYTSNRPEPTEDVLKAVQAVFDFGQVVSTEPIKYYYAPAIVYSAWHETQEYVVTINGHRFFAEVEG